LSGGYWQGLPGAVDRFYAVSVSTSNDIAEFLSSRRARITPEQAGLPSYGQRRVPGLRREEVAALAGMGIDYYRRLERGNVSGVSDSVLEALARALQLDDAERAHLFDLARAASPVAPRRRRPMQQRVRPVVQSILDAIGAPALVRNAHADYIAANVLGRALYAPMFESPEQPPNSARFTFLDPAAVDFYTDWEKVADEIVANLRSEAGRNPHDRDMSDLVGQLSMRSDQFRTRWAQHNVRFHQTGSKRLHHPVVGDLTLSYETMQLTADPGLSLAVYTAEAGSASQAALDILASWSVPFEQPSSDAMSDEPHSG
jgi:transcriptional regulator with XRE-family HTH domain